jgi:hypothetical protein
MPNDALKAYCFFRVWGSRDIEDHLSPSYSHYANNTVDLIFWVDLKNIDNTKDYVFTEELINEAFNTIKQIEGVTIKRVVDERPEDIFRGYTLIKTHRDLLMYPYDAWRFEIELNYELDCQ